MLRTIVVRHLSGRSACCSLTDGYERSAAAWYKAWEAPQNTHHRRQCKHGRPVPVYLHKPESGGGKNKMVSKQIDFSLKLE